MEYADNIPDTVDWLLIERLVDTWNEMQKRGLFLASCIAGILKKKIAKIAKIRTDKQIKDTKNSLLHQ